MARWLVIAMLALASCQETPQAEEAPVYVLQQQQQPAAQEWLCYNMFSTDPPMQFNSPTNKTGQSVFYQRQAVQLRCEPL